MKDIVKEDFDDLKLGKVGAELDDPERGMGKSFKGDSMFDQLGKIIDTQGGADPLKTVVTDDGETIEVDPNQAAELRKLLSCLLYTSPSPRDVSSSRMPSSA